MVIAAEAESMFIQLEAGEIPAAFLLK